jgi:hypothetical protein
MSAIEHPYELRAMAHEHSNKHVGDVEVEALPSFNRDQDDLARLGKRQVLKVCTLVLEAFCVCHLHHNEGAYMSTAKFWLHVHAWL